MGAPGSTGIGFDNRILGDSNGLRYTRQPRRIIRANFLADRMHEYFLAEKYYNKTLDLDPYCVTALTDYAVFLADTKHRNEKSEQLLRKAEEI